eukprot:XP_001693130.1 predicted protein [Chlamydomonas reinhardtii]
MHNSVYRSPRHAQPLAALPEISPAAAAAAFVLGLPASVLIDEAIDSASPRVKSIANETSANGVRMFVARPPVPAGGGGPTKRPAVILIHQILGLQRREVRPATETEGHARVRDTLGTFRQLPYGTTADLAAALAAQEGVVAVAPDCFQGQSTLWPFRAITLGFKYALRDGASWGVESVHEAVRWLQAQPDVDSDRIIVAGFCYGGGAAVRYAAAYPGEAAGVAIFYGRPLLEASEVAKLGRTPVLGLYGTRDTQFPAAMLDKFQADLNAAGVPNRLERFEGEGHAFIKEAKSVEVLRARSEPGAADVTRRVIGCSTKRLTLT